MGVNASESEDKIPASPELREAIVNYARGIIEISGEEMEKSQILAELERVQAESIRRSQDGAAGSALGGALRTGIVAGNGLRIVGSGLTWSDTRIEIKPAPKKGTDKIIRPCPRCKKGAPIVLANLHPSDLSIIISIKIECTMCGLSTVYLSEIDAVVDEWDRIIYNFSQKPPAKPRKVIKKFAIDTPQPVIKLE